MRAFLLSAGYGTRLMPLTQHLPKCLMPVYGGIPIIHVWISNLLNAGFTEVIINTHYKSEMVTDFLKLQKYYKNITIVYEENLLGTAKTLNEHRRYLEDEALLLAHVDNFTDLDLLQFLEFDSNNPTDRSISMVCFRTDNPTECGIVQTSGSLMVDFEEKPNFPVGNLANGAIYLINEPDVSRICRDNCSIDFSSEVLPRYVRRTYIFEYDGTFIDIGNIKNLKKSNCFSPPKGLLECKLGALEQVYSLYLSNMIK